MWQPEAYFRVNRKIGQKAAQGGGGGTSWLVHMHFATACWSHMMQKRLIPRASPLERHAIGSTPPMPPTASRTGKAYSFSVLYVPDSVDLQKDCNAKRQRRGQ